VLVLFGTAVIGIVGDIVKTYYTVMLLRGKVALDALINTDVADGPEGSLSPPETDEADLELNDDEAAAEETKMLNEGDPPQPQAEQEPVPELELDDRVRGGSEPQPEPLAEKGQPRRTSIAPLLPAEGELKTQLDQLQEANKTASSDVIDRINQENRDNKKQGICNAVTVMLEDVVQLLATFYVELSAKAKALVVNPVAAGFPFGIGPMAALSIIAGVANTLVKAVQGYKQYKKGALDDVDADKQAFL